MTLIKSATYVDECGVHEIIAGLTWMDTSSRCVECGASFGAGRRCWRTRKLE